MPLHSKIGTGDIHIPYNFTYADSSARTGASGLTSDDVGKLARQLDDDSLYMLTNHVGPVWTQITSGTVNVSFAAIEESVKPAVDDAYDLGSDSYRWRDLYLGPQTLKIISKTTDGGGLGDDTFSFEINTDGQLVIVDDNASSVVAKFASDGSGGFGGTSELDTAVGHILVSLDGYGGGGDTSDLDEAMTHVLDSLDGYALDSALQPEINRNDHQDTALGDILVALDGYGGGSGDVSQTAGFTGADGYIAFFTGDGEIAGDNDLFWDRPSNSLGIHNESPSGFLHVNNNFVVTADSVDIGDFGNEQGSITVQAGTYDSPLMVHDIGVGFSATINLHRHSTTNGPVLAFSRSNTDDNTHAVVADGQELGALVFLGHDGTDYNRGASISSEVDGTPSANDMPSNLKFSTSADGTNSPALAMTIDSSQQVGIGTENPNELLTVDGVVSLDTVSAPSLTSGYGKVFVGTDAELHYLDELGNNVQLTSGGAVNAAGDTSDLDEAMGHVLVSLDGYALDSDLTTLDNREATHNDEVLLHIKAIADVTDGYLTGIDVGDEGSPTGSFTTLNFVGPRISAVDAGSGISDITVETDDLDTAIGHLLDSVDGYIAGVDVGDEGSPTGTFTTINFIGSRVSAVDAGSGISDVTIDTDELDTAIGHLLDAQDGYLTGIEVEDEGGSIGTGFTRFNFTGAGVTAADAGGGEATITITSGGGGSPGGADKHIQYNDSGSFGGDGDFVWDDANLLISGSGERSVQVFTDVTAAVAAFRATSFDADAYMEFANEDQNKAWSLGLDDTDGANLKVNLNTAGTSTSPSSNTEVMEILSTTTPGNVGFPTASTAADEKLQVDGYIVPQTDNAEQLGTTAKRWQKLHLGPSSLHLDSTISETDNERHWAIGINTASGERNGYMVFRQGADDVAFWGEKTIANPDGLADIVGNLKVGGQLYSTVPSTHVPTGVSQTIDWNDGNIQIIDLANATNDVSLTLSSGQAGASYTLKVIQGSPARDIVWPVSVEWAGGTAPTITATNDAVDVITLIFDGTNYYGAVHGQNFS